MPNHGNGPKIVWVDAYVQKRGRRLTRVRTHRRSSAYPYFCTADNQYDFGF